MAQIKAATPTRLVRRTRQLLQEDIWHHTMVEDRTVRGKIYAVLRVLSITERGIMTKKMFSQAAALSYASLMSLGPIVSLAIMLSTFVLQNNHKQDSMEFTKDMLSQIVTFIAPSTSNLTGNETANNNPDTGAAPPDDSATMDNSAATSQANPELVAMLNSFVTSASNGKVGIFTLVILIFICIQMMISIENNFNSIWGVRRGRDMLRRIVLYWTVFSLGVLAAFTTATVVSAAALGSLAQDYLPAWGKDVLGNFTGVTHLLAFICLTLLLALFYRFIPNTAVRWRPAFIGGVVVAIFLILNNYFSFLYVTTVISKKSLYGSVGIVPILMFGLYVFWVMVLFGGVLTYAVQNANNITADRLWNQVSPRTRRLLNLAAFLQIARTFLRGKPGLTSEEIAQTLRVPAALLNEGLGRLTDLHIVSIVEVPNADGEVESRYQPGRPLHKLTLGKFHLALDLLGNTEGDETLQETDPLLPQYVAALGKFEAGPLLEQTFAELLKDEKSGLTSIPFRV